MIAGRHHRIVTGGSRRPADEAGGTKPPVPRAPVAVVGMTADPALADVVRRLAAAAAVDVRIVDRCPDVGTWQGCELALVRSDLARRMASGRLPRG